MASCCDGLQRGVFFFLPIFPIFSTDAPTTPLHRAGKYRIDKSAGPGAARDDLYQPAGWFCQVAIASGMTGDVSRGWQSRLGFCTEFLAPA